MSDDLSTDAQQVELPLPFPELSRDLPLLPARMLNEHQYCPRLAYLEWVQSEWAESADTAEGRHVHRRVDKPSGNMPPPEEIETINLSDEPAMPGGAKKEAGEGPKNTDEEAPF